MRIWLFKFFREEKAQALTEYGLIFALVVIAIITSLFLYGESLNNNYLNSIDRIDFPAESSGEIDSKRLNINSQIASKSILMHNKIFI
jgi:Flp pilus assembly pilin Flp